MTVKHIWTLTRDPRNVGYDEAGQMVVVAATSEIARRVAAAACHDEGPSPWLSGRRSGREYATIQNVGTARRITVEPEPKDRVLCCDGRWCS